MLLAGRVTAAAYICSYSFFVPGFRKRRCWRSYVICNRFICLLAQKRNGFLLWMDLFMIFTGLSTIRLLFHPLNPSASPRKEEELLLLIEPLLFTLLKLEAEPARGDLSTTTNAAKPLLIQEVPKTLLVSVLDSLKNLCGVIDEVGNFFHVLITEKMYHEKFQHRAVKPVQI